MTAAEWFSLQCAGSFRPSGLVCPVERAALDDNDFLITEW